MKMLLIGILMLCFDSACLSPSKYCEAKTKFFWFFIDCRDEIETQGALMERIDSYFSSLSRTNQVFLQHKIIKSDGQYDFELTPDYKCKQPLPVDQFMAESRELPLNQPAFGCTALNMSIIFISSISDTELAVINKIIAEERDKNIEVLRYFIITTSKNITTDFIFTATSFDSVVVEDIVQKMCDMTHGDVTFTFSGGKYFDTKYFIEAHKVSTISGRAAECYCDESRGVDLLSIETDGEGIFISQILNNLSLYDVNIIVTLGKFKRERYQWLMRTAGLPFFLPHTYIGDYNDCLYINTSSYRVNCVGKPKCNLGSFKETVPCDRPLQNALIICEHNDIPNFQSIPSHDLFKISKDEDVFNKKSLQDFTDLLAFPFDADANPLSTGTWKIKHQHCNLNKMEDHYSLREVERFLCSNNDLTEARDHKEKNDLHSVLNILSTDRHSIFKLKQLNISKCSNYNECQQKAHNETVSINTNADVIFYCFDEVENQDSNGTCTAQVVNFNLSLENFQCESDESQSFYKCIKNDDSQCEDNSNLFHCENFTCLEPFFKCPNSYCIFPFQVRDEVYDCSFGEDDPWAVDQYRSTKALSVIEKLRFRFVLKDICMDSLSYTFLSKLANDSSFICDKVCPKEYQCVSSKSIKQEMDMTESVTTVNIHSVEMVFLNMSNTIYPQYNFFKYIPLISIVQLEANIFTHGLNNFDEGFRHWDLDELLILDLSRNKYLIHSDSFSSITRFSKLKYLNLSYNYNLIIGQNFSFPRSLEIIDLSNTKLYGLNKNVFESLRHLRHLNLSYTLINKFEDLGIPRFFILDTFYIKGVFFDYLLEPYFFRGLTIKQELQTSYYVLCCPVILSQNISVDKCHAPFEFISSCTHLVGNTLKRIVVWLVGLLTVAGNGVVLVYRIGWNREIFKKAYGLFISGLAVSDFIMGVYLVSIACVDTYYEDVYDLKDYRWRKGFMCHLLGFFSTLSSETSTFFICLITTDRFLSITYPFSEHKFSKTGKRLSFTLVWFVGVIVALLPVVLPDGEIYSSNGLCLALPFSSKQYKGWVFSFVVFVVFNFVLFFMIAIGQLIIFLNLLNIKKTISDVGGNSQGRLDEWCVAKKTGIRCFNGFLLLVSGWHSGNVFLARLYFQP